MVFTTVAFAKFFAILLIGLSILRRRTLRQAVILVASAIFYAYWKPSYLLLLLTPSIIDYYCASKIEDSVDPVLRKRWLIASVATNLGLLGYFKYVDFFIGTLQTFSIPLRHLDVALPVGISFFTFKTLSYTVDVYRGDIPTCRSLWRYAMFVTYFPELVAGPIVRASIFLPQMTRSLRPSWTRAGLGAQIILLGVTKKVIIADRLAYYVDSIFRSPALFNSTTVSLGVIAYSLQIYCDFSGYSDMAIGISKIIGFDLPENFNMPYLSVSVTEFWRRWHITLSHWLRDYLYVPLGGNRHGSARTYLNLFLTMLLGGLWHGANWTFVFWGGLHGAGLAIHKLWTSLRGKSDLRPVPGGRVAAWMTTYAFVCVGWVFFRAPTFAEAWLILRKISCVDRVGIEWIYPPLLIAIPVVVLAHIIGVFGFKPLRVIKPSPLAGVYMVLPLNRWAGSFAVTLWVTLAILFAPAKTSPFIYFRF